MRKASLPFIISYLDSPENAKLNNVTKAFNLNRELLLSPLNDATTDLTIASSLLSSPKVYMMVNKD